MNRSPKARRLGAVLALPLVLAASVVAASPSGRACAPQAMAPSACCCPEQMHEAFAGGHATVDARCCCSISPVDRPFQPAPLVTEPPRGTQALFIATAPPLVLAPFADGARVQLARHAARVGPRLILLKRSFLI